MSHFQRNVFLSHIFRAKSPVKNLFLSFWPKPLYFLSPSLFILYLSRFLPLFSAVFCAEFRNTKSYKNVHQNGNRFLFFLENDDIDRQLVIYAIVVINE